MADRYASLKEGLVGCWIPSISGSGLLLPDLSGRGNNGSLVGMDASDWVSASYGRALDFDGSNDFLDYGRCDQLSGLGVLSCSFWCYPKSANEMYGLIRYNTTIALGSERRADYFGIQATGGVLYPVCYFSLAGNVTFFQSFTSTSLPVAQNSWSHIAFSVNLAGNTATIAVNGVSVAGTRSSGGTPPTATAAQGTVTWRSQTYIGSGGTQFYFDGQLDDVRAYNRALTESEIKLLSSEPGIGFKRISSSAFATRYAYKPAKPRNYSVIRNRDPNYSTLRHGLVAAYCPSISGQGNVLPDLVGGNHGTLTNMTADDWVSSGDGRALDFDGVDDSVKSNRILPNLTPAFTLSLWVYVRSLPTSGSIVNILSTYYSTGSQLFGFDLRFRNDAGVHKLGLRGGDGTNTTELGSDEVYELPTLRWINLLFTVTSSGAIGYQDSIQIATYSTMRGVPMNANKTLSVGSLGAYSSPGQELGRFFNGVMDDIRIYNRALTEPEIKLLASKRGIGLEPRKPKITFTDLGVQKTYSVVRVKETDYATLRQGLVGAWCPSLPNGGSGNTLPDQSGYNNHGSLVNMSPDDWVSGQYGRALDFDGVNDLVSITTRGQSQFCVSLWFRIRAFKSSSTDGVIFTIDDGANNNLYIAQRASGSNTLTCNGFDGTVRGIYGTGPALSVNTWTHAVCTAANGLYQIYINGIKTTETAGTVIASNANSITIGNYIDGLRPGDQLIDDVRLYNRALTESEIRLLASRPGIGLRQESHRNTFYQFPSFQPALARRSSAIIGGGIT